jgi:UDP-N-acetylmuramoyl-tripeptide--D-alanyl-D-alanine ligase
VRASEIALVGGRTEFELEFPGSQSQSRDVSAQPQSPGLSAQPQSVHVSARLLGRHNVSNLLAAAAVGDVLGIDRGKIASALGRVHAPDHRLAPISNHAAGVVVIDDAYNSNPDGAAAALEVLRTHEAQRRLLVTPGMVELGELEQQLNRSFGEQAAGICDHVVLVGRTRTEPIHAGLLAGGIDAERVHVVANLNEATELLGTLSRRGDVILFENDLPDTYAEDRE